MELFHDGLGPERWNWGNHITAWNWVAWFSLPWSGSLYEMATLSHLHFPISANRGCCRSLNVLFSRTLQWRHNDHDGDSIHQPHGCLLNRLFRRRSQKTSKLRVTGLCVRIYRWPVNSPHKGPVRRNMFPFDDVIMNKCHLLIYRYWK